MAISKVILNDETLMDVTQDSVTASTLLSGETATGANGVRLTGTATVPEPSSTTPSMDGTAAVGTATTYARADHVHPSDSSKQDVLVSGTNIKTINGDSILGSGDLTVGGGGGYDYRIDVTISGSTVTADFNGASLTEIATAVTDDPATNVVIVVVVGSYTTRGIITYSSYNTAWGDVASNIEFVSFFYDNGDNKYYIRRTSLTGSGYSTTESRCA